MIDYTDEEYNTVIKVMEETNGSMTETIKVNAKDFSIPALDKKAVGSYFAEYKDRITRKTLAEVSEKFRKGCSFKDFFEKRFIDNNYKTIAKEIYNKICEAPRKKIAEEYPDILPKFDEDFNTVIHLIDEGEHPLDVINDFTWTGNGIADFIEKEATAEIPLATDGDIYNESIRLTEYIKELISGKRSNCEDCENNVLNFLIYQQGYYPEDIREAIIARRREGNGFVETLVNQLFSLKNFKNIYFEMQITFDDTDTAFRILTSLAKDNVIDFSGAKLMLTESSRPVNASPVAFAIPPEISSDMLG